MRSYFLRTLLTTIVWVLSGFAQTSTGSITGIVTDQSSSVVVGVTVTVTDARTGQRFVATTNGSGVYVIASLQPGEYSLGATMENFNSVAVNGIKLDPGRVVKQDLALSVSGVAQKVSVEAQATLVNTAGGETGGIITPEQIQHIDVNGRNYQALASLIPGVNNIQAGQQLSGLGLQNGIVISSNGLAINKNLFTVDGSFNMNIGNEAEPAVNPELDVIQEVSIVADNYSAKYGYSAGAQVMVETKSGGQKFHGGAQEYVRNNAFDARNRFAAAVSPLKQNIFGYGIGGPVFIPNVYNQKKEKTFFFWAQNWRVIRQGLLGLGAAPTEAMRNGDFSQEAVRIGKPILDPVTKAAFTNNQIPVGRMDPNALLFLKQLFPLPNNPAGGFNNYVNDAPNKTHQHQALARIDHTFSERVRVMARYIREDTYNAKPFGNFAPSVFPSAATETNTLGKNAYIRITATPSPRVVNNLSYGYSQTNVDGFPLGNASVLPPGSTYTPVLANQDNGRRIPDLTFAGGWTTAGIGTTDSFTDARDQAHTYTDDFSYATGRHILQAGMLLNYAIVTQAVGTTPQGSFNFSGAFTNHPIADFLLGYAATYTQNSKSRRGDLRYFQFEPYFQDDWKVTKGLTLNLGVRWAYIPPWYLLETTAFIPQLYDPAKAPLVSNSGQMTLTPNYSNTNGLAFSGEASLKVPRGFASTPLNTWMPRFGFAWDIFGDGKTSVRGGIGITYYRNEDSVWGTLNNPPISSSVSLVNTSLTNPGGSTALGPLLPSNVSNIPYTMVSSRVATYSLGVQRELGFGTVLHLTVAGSQAIHLPFSRDMNQPLRTGAFDFDPRLNANTINTNAIRPYLGYGSISTKFSDGTSHYDSLQVGVVHRYSRNFSLQLAYTWGKIIGRGNDVDASRQDAYAPRADQGLSKIDRTHIFNLGYVYDLPFYRSAGGALRSFLGGWGISGFTQIDSGFALTPTLATGDRGLATRPSVSGQPLFGSGTHTIATWFNPATFIAPPPGFFGNAANGVIRGPGLIDFDFSINKRTHLYKEKVDSEFRAEFFNVVNHPNLLGISTGFGSGTYGRVISALDPRIMEFGFKVIF